jgi:hypothetical protein
MALAPNSGVGTGMIGGATIPKVNSQGQPTGSVYAPTAAPPPPPTQPAASTAPTPAYQPAPPPAAPGATQAPGEFSGPGFGEQYGMSHVGQYDTPTALETFAQQQLQGNNPYYDTLRTQGDAAINAQLAARGEYNSDGALSALGNFNAQTYADQFANMGNLLGSAGNMQLQREGQGQNVANSVQAQQAQRGQNQFNNLLGIAGLGSQNTGKFYDMGMTQSGDAAMGGTNAGANAAQLTGQGQNALPNTAMSFFNSYLGRGGGSGGGMGFNGGGVSPGYTSMADAWQIPVGSD